MPDHTIRICVRFLVGAALTTVPLFAHGSQHPSGDQEEEGLPLTAESAGETVSGPADAFEARQHPFQNMILPYRLFVPAAPHAAGRYPIVIALHGSGERGSDNLVQITANKLAVTWSDSAYQAGSPCFVVAPQCPSNRWWVETTINGDGGYTLANTAISQPLAAVVDLLDSLIQTLPVDTDRMYLTGLSMGGYGTWDLIMRYPRRFAAAVPICGGGDSSQTSALLHVPIWAFHGDQDGSVSVRASRDMMKAFAEENRVPVCTHCLQGTCTSNPDSAMTAALARKATLLYTEYAGGGHMIWNQSYDLPQLHQWVFEQKLERAASSVPRLPRIPISFTLLQNYPNPFNPATTIRYSLKTPSLVRLGVYNVLGQRIRVLQDAFEIAGEHVVRWDGNDASGRPASSGFYYYRLETGEGSGCRTMALVR